MLKSDNQEAGVVVFIRYGSDIHIEGKGFGAGFLLVVIYFYMNDNGGIFFPPEVFERSGGVDLFLSEY